MIEKKIQVVLYKAHSSPGTQVHWSNTWKSKRLTATHDTQSNRVPDCSF